MTLLKYGKMCFIFQNQTCFCFTNQSQISLVPSVWCNFTCPGNPNQLCGGNGTLASLYITGSNEIVFP